jgi:WD40 repeat protein
MCMKKSDLYAKAKWDGAEGSSRQHLLDDLQGEYPSHYAATNRFAHPGHRSLEFLPTGVIMPPQRLATLFDQARRYQEACCTYHSGSRAETLLSDHRCQREVFPTVATHVLAEHTDEVWTIAWSADGQHLASAGKDKLIHIWKIEVRRRPNSVPGCY